MNTSHRRHHPARAAGTPPRRTHQDLVLDHLASGRSLTADEARELYGVRRLAARILDLREAGFDIKKELVCGTAVYRLGGAK